MHARFEPRSEFTALIDDLLAFQDAQETTARVRRAAAQHGVDSQQIELRKALDTDTRGALAELNHTTRQIMHNMRRQAVTAPSRAVTHRRQQREHVERVVERTMAKALSSAAAGRLTAAEVARLEAAGQRILASLR